jgi:hypothetical protein
MDQDVGPPRRIRSLCCRGTPYTSVGTVFDSLCVVTVVRVVELASGVCQYGERAQQRPGPDERAHQHPDIHPRFFSSCASLTSYTFETPPLGCGDNGRCVADYLPFSSLCRQWSVSLAGIRSAFAEIRLSRRCACTAYAALGTGRRFSRCTGAARNHALSCRLSSPCFPILTPTFSLWHLGLVRSSHGCPRRSRA